MRTLAEQISNKCIHFNGLETKTCDAGVVYLTVKASDESVKGFARYPCFREGEAVPCEKRHFPTSEEVAAEVEEHNARWERLKLGIGAASEDAKKHGYGKGNAPRPATRR